MGPGDVESLQEGLFAGCLPKQSLYYGLWRSCYSGAESIQNSCYSEIQERTAITTKSEVGHYMLSVSNITIKSVLNK